MNILSTKKGYNIGFRGHDIDLTNTIKTEENVLITSKIMSIENHGSDFVYGLNFQDGHIFIKEVV